MEKWEKTAIATSNTQRFKIGRPDYKSMAAPINWTERFRRARHVSKLVLSALSGTVRASWMYTASNTGFPDEVSIIRPPSPRRTGSASYRSINFALMRSSAATLILRRFCGRYFRSGFQRQSLQRELPAMESYSTGPNIGDEAMFFQLTMEKS